MFAWANAEFVSTVKAFVLKIKGPCAGPDVVSKVFAKEHHQNGNLFVWSMVSRTPAHTQLRIRTLYCNVPQLL
jgi:hypothetical protein